MNQNTSSLTLSDVAEFIWLWNHEFFLEAGKKGNFIWSDPEHGGDNTIRPCKETYNEYIRGKVPYGRSKGDHTIGGYCGEDVKILP